MSRLWTSIVRTTAPRLAAASTRGHPAWHGPAQHRRHGHTDADAPPPAKLLASHLKGYLKLVGARQAGPKADLRARLAAILSQREDVGVEARFAAAGLKATKDADMAQGLESARNRLVGALVEDGVCGAGGLDGFVAQLEAPEEVVVAETPPPSDSRGGYVVTPANGQLSGLRGGKRKKMVEALLRTQMLSLYRRCLRSAERCPSQDWADTMLHYVRIRFREGNVSPGNVAIVLSAGEIELANMNILHAQREERDAENAGKEWRQ